MTDLGLAFDDDDLDTQKKKGAKDKDLPYHVKIVAPLWFDEAVNLIDCPGQEPQVLKFRGDYRYRLKDYSGAAEQYKAALDILPENNSAVSQDLRESLARCYAFMGKHDDGLKLARDLVNEMSTEDEAHQRQSLMLLSFVCEKAGQWEECVQSLQKLCLLQPNFPQLWYQLGDVLSHYMRPEISNCSRLHNDPAQNSVHQSTYVNGSNVLDDNSSKHLLGILMCYSRAKFLLESVMSSASDVIKVRNRKFLTEIEEKMRHLPVTENLRQRVYKHVPKSTEIQAGELKETEDKSKADRVEDQSEICEVQDITQRFYKTFCPWILKS